MAEYRVPMCRKCGRAHYNFERCEDPNAGSMRAAVVVRQPRPGLRDWQGDKLRTMRSAHGEVTALRQLRQFTEAGRVTGPDNKPVSLPRLPAPRATLTPPEEVNNG